jgi:transcriptional regulator with XRE-family HTH domain
MNLREWLFGKRISITFFAALMKVDRSYVHRWLKGNAVPSDAIMEKIREISFDKVYNKEDLKDVKVSREDHKTD